MVSVAKLAFDANGQPNRHAFHDVGLAVANLIVQATALGLGVHQMAGFTQTGSENSMAFQTTLSPSPGSSSAIRGIRRSCLTIYGNGNWRPGAQASQEFLCSSVAGDRPLHWFVSADSAHSLRGEPSARDSAMQVDML